MSALKLIKRLSSERASLLEVASNIISDEYLSSVLHHDIMSILIRSVLMYNNVLQQMYRRNNNDRLICEFFKHITPLTEENIIELNRKYYTLFSSTDEKECNEFLDIVQSYVGNDLNSQVMVFNINSKKHHSNINSIFSTLISDRIEKIKEKFIQYLIDSYPANRDNAIYIVPYLFNDGKFHPAVRLNSILTAQRLVQLDTVKRQSKKTPIVCDRFPATVPDLYLYLQYFIPSYTNEEYPSKFSKPTRRNRKTFKHTTKVYAESSHGIFKELCGRIYTNLIPATHAESLMMEKDASFSLISDEDLLKDINTTVVALLIRANMISQRAFTTHSAKHDQLSDVAGELINVLKTTNTINYSVLASLRPEFIPYTTEEFQQTLLKLVVKRLCISAIALEKIWQTGVKEQAIRFPNPMMVPRSGTTNINVSAWNAIAGAWNKSLLYLNALLKQLNLHEGYIPLFKVLKMTAGDQMKMGEREYNNYLARKDLTNEEREHFDSLKKAKRNQAVFRDLSAMDITGWQALINIPNFYKLAWLLIDTPVMLIYELSFSKISTTMIFPACEEVRKLLSDSTYKITMELESKGEKTNQPLIGIIERACGIVGLHKNSYLYGGELKEGYNNISTHPRRMICGIEVKNISKDFYSLLKLLGFAGANGWNG
jgi:hypothetical protein